MASDYQERSSLSTRAHGGRNKKPTQCHRLFYTRRSRLTTMEQQQQQQSSRGEDKKRASDMWTQGGARSATCIYLLPTTTSTNIQNKTSLARQHQQQYGRKRRTALYIYIYISTAFRFHIERKTRPLTRKRNIEKGLPQSARSCYSITNLSIPTFYVPACLYLSCISARPSCHANLFPYSPFLFSSLLFFFFLDLIFSFFLYVFST